MNRDVKIDIVKGLAIILVVLGHAQFPFKQYIILFHVGVFFMASGYCYNERYSKNIKGIFELFIKRMKTLYLLFVICNVIYLVLENIFIRFHLYADAHIYATKQIESGLISLKHYMSIKEMAVTIIKIVLLQEGTTMGGALWFLKELYIITLLFAIILWGTKNIKTIKVKNTLVFFIVVILLVIGYCLGRRDSVMTIGIAFSSLSVYAMGYFFRKIKDSGKIQVKLFIELVITILSIIAIYYLEKIGKVQYSYNKYTSPQFLVIVAILGWIITYNLAKAIKQVCFLRKVFTYIGQNTLPILILHFLCFKLITALQIYMYHDEIVYLAAFPVYKSNSVWWVVYTAVGIGIPLIVNASYLKIKKRIIESWKK